MKRIVKAAEDRKQEIMDTAERLFMQKGYDQVTVQVILQEIGIAKGTFYHHFPSKDELLQAVLTRRLDVIGQRATQVLELPIGALDKLRAVLGIIFSTGQDSGGITLDSSDDKYGLMHRKLTQMFYKRVEPVLVEVTRQGIQEGIFETADPQAVTTVLLRGITGYVSEHFREMKDPASAARHMHVIGFILARVLGLKEIGMLFANNPDSGAPNRTKQEGDSE